MEPSYDERDFSQADDLIHQRQRFYRRSQRAGHVLNQLLARSGYLQRQSQDELAVQWQEAVGARWRGQTQVGRIRRGVLEVEAANSSVVQHLNFQKNRLLQELQRRLPGQRIRDLRFRVGKIDPSVDGNRNDNQES